MKYIKTMFYYRMANICYDITKHMIHRGEVCRMKARRWIERGNYLFEKGRRFGYERD